MSGRGRWPGLDRAAPWAGIVGTGAIAAGSVVTALAYRGADGESYNPLNHFVSELGELANSELAGVFNLAVIVSGVCLIVFMSGLAATGGGRLRQLAGAVGVVSGLGGALVGVFPMDVIGPHSLAAMTFFNLGGVAIGVASLDFVRHRDPRFPRWLAVLGVATLVALGAFLREVGAYTRPSGALAGQAVRPEVWAFTTFEWLTLVGIVGWVLLGGVSWLRAGATVVPTERRAFSGTNA